MSRPPKSKRSFLLTLRRSATSLVAPESLSLHDSTTSCFDSQGTQPGDIVLLRTPGPIYSAVRVATGQPYDHAVVVVDNNQAVHVSPPTVRLLPVDAVLISSRHPMVIRPNFESTAAQRTFVSHMASLVGAPYSTSRLFSLLWRLVVFRQVGFNMTPPMHRGFQTPTSPWICTDAILESLLKSSVTAQNVIQNMNPPLDFVGHGITSLKDLLRVQKAAPRFFSILPTTAFRPAAEEAWNESCTVKPDTRQHNSERAIRVKYVEQGPNAGRDVAFFNRFATVSNLFAAVSNFQNWLMSDIDLVTTQYYAHVALNMLQQYKARYVPDALQQAWDSLDGRDQGQPNRKAMVYSAMYVVGLVLVLKQARKLVTIMWRIVQGLLLRRLIKEGVALLQGQQVKAKL